MTGCSQSQVFDISTQQKSPHGTSSARAYAYELTSETPGSELQAFGLAPHAHAGSVDWTAINFFDPDEALSPTTVFAGIPVGNTPELWGTYTPRMALHNFAEVSQEVSINLNSTIAGSVRRVPVKSIHLDPGQSTSLDLTDVSGDSTLLNTLTVDGSEESGGIVAQLLLEDSSQDIRFQIIGKSVADQRNIGMHPWSLSDSKDSVLLLYNEMPHLQSAAIRLGNGTRVWEKSVDMAPFATQRLAVRQMITEHWVDDKGNPLTRGEGHGSFSWSAPRHGILTGRLLQLDDQARTVESFQCAGYQVLCNGSISGPTNISLGKNYTWNGSTQGCINNQSPVLCSGVVSGGMGPESYSWNTGLSPSTSTSPYLSAQATSPGNYGISVTMNGDACSVYASTQVQASGPCPTTIVVNSNTAISITANPNLHTGYGDMVSMLVGPASTDFSTAFITESVTTTSNTCPFPVYPTITAAGSAGFNIGDAAQLDDNSSVFYNAIHNAFYDEISVRSTNSLLSASKPSCAASATHTYYCAGRAIGTFTDNTTITLGNANGGAASIVTTKQQ